MPVCNRVVDVRGNANPIVEVEGLHAEVHEQLRRDTCDGFKALVLKTGCIEHVHSPHPTFMVDIAFAVLDTSKAVREKEVILVKYVLVNFQHFRSRRLRQ
jgi:hypothetical protein